MNARLLGAAVAVVLGVATQASAATMTMIETASFTDASSLDLRVDGFDTSLGTLTNVALSLDGTATLEDGSID